VNPDAIGLFAEALLANLAADMAPTVTVPARRFFSHGPPPRDCDQLAVYWQGISPSFGGRTLGAGAAQQTAPRHATPVLTWAVDLVVCTPATMTPEAPTPAAMTAQAALGARHGWVLYRTLTARWLAGTLFNPYDGTAAQGMAPGVSQPIVDGGLVVITASFSYNHLQEPPT
jgi:hypothetical protein